MPWRAPNKNPMHERQDMKDNDSGKLIAIVEDDPDIARIIEQVLGDFGFRTLWCRSGNDLLRRLRKKTAMPFIFLTSKTDELDEALGLAMGADDYIAKPFSRSELLARVRTILRRGRSGTESTTLCVADLELDLLRRRVTRAGKRIDLTAKEFGLLELLMRRSGEVLPRSLIASQVWDMNFDSDTNVIEVAMRRLRIKIDEGQDVKLIQTVRGMGYVLEAPEEP